MDEREHCVGGSRTRNGKMKHIRLFVQIAGITDTSTSAIHKPHFTNHYALFNKVLYTVRKNLRFQLL
jgi:hypothetical protein